GERGKVFSDFFLRTLYVGAENSPLSLALSPTLCAGERGKVFSDFFLRTLYVGGEKFPPLPNPLPHTLCGGE
ncbi:hypothetical protein, partial [Legionella micdadei]